MKKLLKTFLALTFLLFTGELTSCEENILTKHVVSLTSDNLNIYIDLKFEGTSSNLEYYFIGSLSYAFYDNVKFITDSVYSLSASGYAKAHSSSSLNDAYMVSGSVIYWL